MLHNKRVKIPKGNPTNADEAVRACTAMVKACVKKWMRNHYGDFNDLMQSGFCGVMHAYSKFDFKKNVKFTTYAYFWIRAYVREAAMKNWHVQNHSARLDKVDFMAEAPSGPEEIFRFANFMHFRSKLDPADAQLLDWRAEGYTYSEIQEKTGASNLSVVRKKVMDLVAQIERD
tara:strand:- start:5372 stop:5893 length:522 start_codon:yes stop_codon:yes gene_type:complete